MTPPNKTTFSLTVQVNPDFLPVVTAFIEKSSRAFGLGESEALSLTLAAEEVFSYLCSTGRLNEALSVTCTNGRYYVQEEFRFRAEHFNVRAFNLTASALPDEDADWLQTGLLIASRMVDRFQFFQEDGTSRLLLRKEKHYPELENSPVISPQPLRNIVIRHPDPEELKVASHLIAGNYPLHWIPQRLRVPGKLVDMVQSGDFGAAVAADTSGHLGGLVVWHTHENKLIGLYGPYVCDRTKSSDISRGLIESFIGIVAKSGAIGILNRYPTPEIPTEYFEILGSFTIRAPSGDPVQSEAYYRHLEEDLGMAVWSHPLLEGFLREQYEKLFFARDIQLITSEGETSSPFSVLSAHVDRKVGRVTLRPVWWGKDAEENLADHVRVLKQENIPQIFFEMDLGRSWHSRFTPGLLNTGFEPRLVLPYAGAGDLVMFQLRDDEAHV